MSPRIWTLLTEIQGLGFSTWQGVKFLEFCIEGSDHRLVWAELFPPGWPLQHLASLHHRRPQVLVELRERETKISYPERPCKGFSRSVREKVKNIRDRIEVSGISRFCYLTNLLKLAIITHNMSRAICAANGKDLGKPKGFWRGRFKLNVLACPYLSISAANRWVENEIRRCKNIHQCYCIILQLEERHRAEQVSNKQSRALTVQRYEDRTKERELTTVNIVQFSLFVY